MKLWGLEVSRLLSRPDVVINVDGGSCSRRTKVSILYKRGLIMDNKRQQLYENMKLEDDNFEEEFKEWLNTFTKEELINNLIDFYKNL